MNVQNATRFGVPRRAARLSSRGVVLGVALASALACSGDAAESRPADGGALTATARTSIPPRADPIVPAASEPEPPADESAAEPSAASDEAASDEAASDTLSFATDVWPIFNSHCGPCHETQRAGGHNVGSDDADISFAVAVARKDQIVRDLRTGTMPLSCRGAPGADGCISKADFATIEEWFAEGSPP